jgi:hypothetical protein
VRISPIGACTTYRTLHNKSRSTSRAPRARPSRPLPLRFPAPRQTRAAQLCLRSTATCARLCQTPRPARRRNRQFSRFTPYLAGARTRVGLCFLRPSRPLKSTRCTHLSSCMPYRDPARKAAWMREYRNRKHATKISAPLSRASSPSIVRAREPSRVPDRIIERTGPQPARPNDGFARGGGCDFKTALEVTQSFPFGILASGVSILL